MEFLQTMFGILREQLEKHTTLNDKEFAQGTPFFLPKKIKKDQYLVQEGEICKHLALVTHGSLRSYTIDGKGEEHVVQFAFEGWWITDLYSFLTSQPTTYFIDALEDSDVLLIDVSSYNNLCSTLPKFERYFRILLQNNYIASHRRILASISLSAEERYLQLLESHPAI